MLSTNTAVPSVLNIGYLRKGLPPENPLELSILRCKNMSSFSKRRKVSVEGASEGMSSRLPLLFIGLHQMLEAGFG